VSGRQARPIFLHYHFATTGAANVIAL